MAGRRAQGIACWRWGGTGTDPEGLERWVAQEPGPSLAWALCELATLLAQAASWTSI